MSSKSCCKMMSNKLFRNYILFCVLYSISHGTVNVVLSFAAAELGVTLASLGGFAIYFGFTLSSLLIGKPFNTIFGSKYSLITAMLCHVIYVISFCFCIYLTGKVHPSSTSLSTAVFLIGSSIGGVGEGLMWTSQGPLLSLWCHIKLI